MKNTVEFSDFQLASGETLPLVEAHYTSYGTMNADKSNVVWVFHPVAMSSDVFEWWEGLFGIKCFFSNQKHFIICVNSLGSCFGTTGPLSTNPLTGKPYFHGFPSLQIGDLVGLCRLLADHLGIVQANTFVGGGFGGQQALLWAMQDPGFAKNMVLISTNSRQSQWLKGVNESMRLALKADPDWLLEDARAGKNGLVAAFSFFSMFNNNYENYSYAYGKLPPFFFDHREMETPVEYQRYVSERFAKRFNAFSFLALLDAMDSFNEGVNSQDVDWMLSKIQSNVLVIGNRSDLLFPLIEQQKLASKIPGAVFREFDSKSGHYGYLADTMPVSIIIEEFLTNKER